MLCALVLFCTLACLPARAGSDDDEEEDPPVESAMTEPSNLVVFPGHVVGRPPRAVKGGFCYYELPPGVPRPRSIFELDAYALRKVVNVEPAVPEAKPARALRAPPRRDPGAVHGAPPAVDLSPPAAAKPAGIPGPNPGPNSGPNSAPSAAAPPPKRIKSDISAFGASGPTATPFTIKHGVQVQTFFQHSEFDLNSPPRDSFTLRRFVIYAIGELGRPQTTWSYTLIAQGPITFGTHAWVQEEFNHALRIRFGEFKMPTARQQLAPTRELLTIDKSLATRVFAANSLNPLGGDAIDPLDLSIIPTHGMGDNIGIQIWGDSASGEQIEDPQFRYFLGAFKGPATGAKGPLLSGLIDATGLVNDNNGLVYIGRLELQPLGYVSYSEGALEVPKHPKLAIDLTCSLDDNQLRIDIDGDKLQGPDFDDQQDRINYVVGLRSTINRFSLSSEYFHQHTRPQRADLPRIDSHGYYYTVGYLLKPKKMEICYNDSLVVLDESRPGTELRERGPALNYYLTGHKQKLTLDHTHMTSEPEPFKSRTETRMQYLYAF